MYKRDQSPSKQIEDFHIEEELPHFATNQGQTYQPSENIMIQKQDEKDNIFDESCNEKEEIIENENQVKFRQSQIEQDDSTYPFCQMDNDVSFQQDKLDNRIDLNLNYKTQQEQLKKDIQEQHVQDQHANSCSRQGDDHNDEFNENHSEQRQSIPQMNEQNNENQQFIKQNYLNQFYDHQQNKQDDILDTQQFEISQQIQQFQQNHDQISTQMNTNNIQNTHFEDSSVYNNGGNKNLGEIVYQNQNQILSQSQQDKYTLQQNSMEFDHDRQNFVDENQFETINQQQEPYQDQNQLQNEIICNNNNNNNNHNQNNQINYNQNEMRLGNQQNQLSQYQSNIKNGQFYSNTSADNSTNVVQVQFETQQYQINQKNQQSQVQQSMDHFSFTPQQQQHKNAKQIELLKEKIIETSSLIKENKKLQLKITTLDEEMKNLKFQLENTHDSQKKYQNELSCKNTEISEYKQQIQLLESQIKQLNASKKKNRNEQKNQQNQIIDELKQEIRDYQEDIEKKTKRIIDQQRMIENIKKQDLKQTNNIQTQTEGILTQKKDAETQSEFNYPQDSQIISKLKEQSALASSKTQEDNKKQNQHYISKATSQSSLNFDEDDDFNQEQIDEVQENSYQQNEDVVELEVNPHNKDQLQIEIEKNKQDAQIKTPAISKEMNNLNSNVNTQNKELDLLAERYLKKKLIHNLSQEKEEELDVLIKKLKGNNQEQNPILQQELSNINTSLIEVSKKLENQGSSLTTFLSQQNQITEQNHLIIESSKNIENSKKNNEISLNKILNSVNQQQSQQKEYLQEILNSNLSSFQDQMIQMQEKLLQNITQSYQSIFGNLLKEQQINQVNQQLVLQNQNFIQQNQSHVLYQNIAKIKSIEEEQPHIIEYKQEQELNQQNLTSSNQTDKQNKQDSQINENNQEQIIINSENKIEINQVDNQQFQNIQSQDYINLETIFEDTQEQQTIDSNQKQQIQEDQLNTNILDNSNLKSIMDIEDDSKINITQKNTSIEQNLITDNLCSKTQQLDNDSTKMDIEKSIINQKQEKQNQKNNITIQKNKSKQVSQNIMQQDEDIKAKEEAIKPKDIPIKTKETLIKTKEEVIKTKEEVVKVKEETEKEQKIKRKNIKQVKNSTNEIQSEIPIPKENIKIEQEENQKSVSEEKLKKQATQQIVNKKINLPKDNTKKQIQQANKNLDQTKDLVNDKNPAKRNDQPKPTEKSKQAPVKTNKQNIQENNSQDLKQNENIKNEIEEEIEEDDIKLKKKPKKMHLTIDQILKSQNIIDTQSNQQINQSDINLTQPQFNKSSLNTLVSFDTTKLNQKEEGEEDSDSHDEDDEKELDLKDLSILLENKKQKLIMEQEQHSISYQNLTKTITSNQLSKPKLDQIIKNESPSDQNQQNNIQNSQPPMPFQFMNLIRLPIPPRPLSKQQEINKNILPSKLIQEQPIKLLENNQPIEISINQQNEEQIQEIEQSLTSQLIDNYDYHSSGNLTPVTQSPNNSFIKSQRSQFQFTTPMIHTNQQFINAQFLEQIQTKGLKQFLQDELSIQQQSNNYYKIFNCHYEILRSMTREQIETYQNILQSINIENVLLTIKYSQFQECLEAKQIQHDYNIFTQYFLNRDNLHNMEKSYSYLFQKRNIQKKEEMLLNLDPFIDVKRKKFLIIFSLLCIHFKLSNLECKILELLEYSVKGGVNYDFIYIFVNTYPQIYLPTMQQVLQPNEKKMYQISEKDVNTLITLKKYYQFNESDIHYNISNITQENIKTSKQQQPKEKANNKKNKVEKEDKQKLENIDQNQINILQNDEEEQGEIISEKQLMIEESQINNVQVKNNDQKCYQLQEYSSLIQTLRMIIIIVIYQEYSSSETYNTRIKVHQLLQIIESFYRINGEKSNIDDIILKQMNLNDVNKRLQEQILGYKKNYLFFQKRQQNTLLEDMIMNFMLRYYIIFGDLKLQKWNKSEKDIYIHFNYYDFIGSFNLLIEFIRQTDKKLAEKIYTNVLKGYFTNPKYSFTVLKTLQIVNIYKLIKIIQNQTLILEIQHNFQRILEGTINNSSKPLEFNDIDSSIVQNLFS